VIGQAHPTEQIRPFGPWMEAFRTGGIVHDAVLRGRRSEPWRAELARLLPDLGPPPPREDPAKLFEAVATLLGALAARQPLLVALGQRFGSSDFSRVFASSRLAWTLAELGEFGEAEQAAHEAVRTAERFRQPYLLSHAYRATAYACLRRGDFEDAIAWLERLRGMEAGGSFQVLFPVARWLLAYAYALAGRPDAATLLGPSSRPSSAEERVFVYPLWLACLAEAWLLTGRPVDAHALATNAVDLAYARGERGHAAWSLTAAQAMYREMGMVAWQPRAKAALAAVLSSRV